MEFLVKEFDSSRFPFRYTLKTAETHALTVRGQLEQAAQNLDIQIQYDIQHISSRETGKQLADFVFNVAVTKEADYSALMGELDQLLDVRSQLLGVDQLEQQTHADADAHFLARYRAKHGAAESHQIEHQQDIDWELG